MVNDYNCKRGKKSIHFYSLEQVMDDGLEDDDADSGEEGPEDPNGIPHVGFLSTTWSFIVTFFMSLIPEGPPKMLPTEAMSHGSQNGTSDWTEYTIFNMPSEFTPRSTQSLYNLPDHSALPKN
jgi:hypothetical protein